MKGRLAGLVVLVGLSFAVPCGASEGERRTVRWLADRTSAWAQRPVLIEARLSPSGSPTGLAAGAVSYSPLPPLSLGVGVGVSFNGPQYEAMARLRAVSFEWTQSSSAVSLGAGVSGGKYHEFGGPVWADTEVKLHREWDHTWWFNGEVSFETQWQHGVSVRLYVGNEWNLARDSGRCVGNSGSVPLSKCGSDGYTYPYAGMALGYAFAL